MKFVLSWINGKGYRTRKKKCLTIDDYERSKVLDKTKEIVDIEKFDNIKILIDTDDRVNWHR